MLRTEFIQIEYKLCFNIFKIKLSDLQERVRSDTWTGNTDTSDVIGRYGEHIVSNSVERLIDLYESFAIRILNDFFAHKSRHKCTWYQKTKNIFSIIDYVIRHQSLNIKTMDVRFYRGPECGSYHFLVKAKMMFNYKANQLWQKRCTWSYRNGEVEKDSSN